VFGLLGPNGSGKTTTLKMLLGLLYPTKGKSLCLGADSTDPRISARIGFMPEESYLYSYLNARETLDFYGKLFGLPSRVRRIRIEALIDMVGLRPAASRPVGTYSKGMARRIGLAQALINDPELLILDEPTTGLDPIGTRQIKDLIKELARRGKTVLLCSHLLADVEDVCDRIAILYAGRIQAEGKVRQLLQQAHKRQITTGAIGEATLKEIERLVRGDNADFSVSSPMEKLETFFIRTVAEARRHDRELAASAVGDYTDPVGAFASGAAAESILDKLVSAEITPGRTAEPDVPAAAPDRPGAPDDELLRRLSEPRPADSGDENQPPDTVTSGPQSGQKQNGDRDLLENLSQWPSVDETDPEKERSSEGD
jgi:ABC-2 type transport system ATP-binding protein